MKAAWLAVLFFALAMVTRAGRAGENYALSFYRESQSAIIAVSVTTIVFWLLLAIAALLACVAFVQRIGAA